MASDSRLGHLVNKGDRIAIYEIYHKMPISCSDPFAFAFDLYIGAFLAFA